MDSLNIFSREVLCTYNGETYSVRDNGAILRHPKEGMRSRVLDDIWTFGKVDKKSGYLIIGNDRVHRIVATAFHGEAPTKEHVVDHINTNRQDNRPENLRWVTKLENILLNPITCKKLMLKTGLPIDYILQHIEILHKMELPQDISWMKSVTKEESENCYNNMLQWALNDKIKPSVKRGTIGEWIFHKKFVSEVNENLDICYSETENALYDKTRMKLTYKFPCCPAGKHEHSLQEYLDTLKKGNIFFETEKYKVLVGETAFYNESIIVLTNSADKDAIKPYGITIITLEKNVFIHETYSTFFEKEGAIKYFTILQGKEWTGGEVFDDGCM